MKFISLLIACITLASTAYSAQLKGSDLISTRLGKTYNYQRTMKDGKNGGFFKVLVLSCNKDKTLCAYKDQAEDAQGKNIKFTHKYYYKISKDGSVYTYNPSSKIKSLLFPGQIKLNKLDQYEDKTINGRVVGVSTFTKELPEIEVNGIKYKKCIQLNAESVTYKDKQAVNKTKSEEIYCKGVGLVKEHINENGNNYINSLKTITNTVN